jgi:two-component system, NtrC family, response regulator HydG
LAKILVVDDEQKMVVLLKSALEHRGHEVSGVYGGQDALDLVAKDFFDVVLTDLRMEPVDGMAVIAGVKDVSPQTAVVVLTAYGEVATAVEALQMGAYQYLTKPFNFQEVGHVVEQAAETAMLSKQNNLLKETVYRMSAGDGLVGEAAATEKLRDMIARVAPSDATVLIRGESGTGKEVAARAIHQMSGRSSGPFIAVNCAAIAESLLESELFGYVKGAFTGADKDRQGVFEAANGGTIFLDEIGEAGSAIQAKMLRVLEEKKINRVGDPREQNVDVRILAATNKPLEDAIAHRTFREDLYYRLLVFPVDVPPLRDRVDDIPVLVAHFLGQLGRKDKKFPAGAISRMKVYGWPGNIRELRNLVERAHILAGPEKIGDDHIILDVGGRHAQPGASAQDQDLNLDNNARRLIGIALERAGGNKSLAAKMLGITRRTLYSRFKLLGMEDELD